MTLSVFCILLFAALLHASWNAIVKAGNDKLYSAIGVSGSAAIMALICLPFAPQPSAASLPFLAVSTALQVVYTVLVAKTYQVSDMSQTYPLMRGTAPLLVAIISVLFLGDSLSTLARVGIATICWLFSAWHLTDAAARNAGSFWRSLTPVLLPVTRWSTAPGYAYQKPRWVIRCGPSF